MSGKNTLSILWPWVGAGPVCPWTCFIGRRWRLLHARIIVYIFSQFSHIHETNILCIYIYTNYNFLRSTVLGQENRQVVWLLIFGAYLQTSCKNPASFALAVAVFGHPNAKLHRPWKENPGRKISRKWHCLEKDKNCHRIWFVGMDLKA